MALAAIFAPACRTAGSTAPTGDETRADAVSTDRPLRYADGFDPARAAELRRALELTVHEVAGVERRDEIAISGVPLPRALGLTDPRRVVVVDAKGAPLPTQAHVLARHDAPLSDARAPIQWLLVAFPARVAANTAARYRLVVDDTAGPAPAPALAITVSEAKGQIAVGTGVARFVIDPTGAVSEATLTDGTRVIGGARTAATVGKKAYGLGAARSVRVERSGPLMATVVVEGTTSMPAEGGGGLAFTRRYTFRAGSPTVVVESSLAWEGERCSYDVLSCDGRPNGLRVEGWRERLEVDLGADRTVLMVSAFDQAGAARWTKGQGASLRQRQRAARTAPPKFEAQLPGQAMTTGALATGGYLSMRDERREVAVALGHMHRLEPQALRVLEDGAVALDLADDHVWLAARQGLYADYAVRVATPGGTRADVDRELWAPLAHPLRPWPSAEWWSASGALPQFPVGPLAGSLERYDAIVLRVLSETFDRQEKLGLYGLTTWGAFPRYWHAPYGQELDCDDDPTPRDRWDDSFWCTTWTDYHNTSYLAANHALRSGETAWIDEVVVPAAKRMLHTQIIQCAPGDAFPFCGRGATGYRAFRSDANSSHQYWDSLFLYYWLTGDSRVIGTITPGMDGARRFSCSRRAANQGACRDGDGPADEYWTGRIGYQFASAYRFLGLAGPDGSFLDDYRGDVARLVTQRYVEVEEDGARHGFLTDARPDGAPVLTSAQLWMASLYDLYLFERLRLDTEDAPIGQPPLPPSHVLDAWARALSRYGGARAPGADNTVRGAWSEMLSLRVAGPRVGGKLAAVDHFAESGDPLLYPGGKACLSGVMAAAAARTGEAALRDRAVELTCYALDDLFPQELLLGKVAGISLSRLPWAVGIMAERGWTCP